MFYDIEQNTDEWLELRAGTVGGSSISKVMANYGKAFGAPAKALALDIALYKVRGYFEKQGYSNAHMQRGHEQESIAKQLYEDHNFIDVLNGGFFENGLTSCSPDGLVEYDGMIEIKSVIASVHYAYQSKDTYDSSYKWQMLHEMKEANRDWVDFVSYCAEYPLGNQLHIKRLFRADFSAEYEKMDIRLKEFSLLVEKITDDVSFGGAKP